MAGIYTFAPPWGLSRVPMPCWQRKTSARVFPMIYVGANHRGRTVRWSPPRAARKWSARDENGIFLRPRDADETRGATRGVLIVSGGRSAPTRSATIKYGGTSGAGDKLPGYRSVIDCLARLPAFFANCEKRPGAQPESDYAATRLFNACNLMIYLRVRCCARERYYYFSEISKE